ncbi:Uncharacterised protein [Streptococcus acidominimus]|uniref:Uncharacterized protein n=1 Tax=Streptococcus acidominimus TaxID=1326 RepID=A0A380JMP3_STRAI|nr:Uncharacterised protein [Streptococcus acidominimus]
MNELVLSDNLAQLELEINRKLETNMRADKP